jgi:hypothetical protein
VCTCLCRVLSLCVLERFEKRVKSRITDRPLFFGPPPLESVLQASKPPPRPPLPASTQSAPAVPLIQAAYACSAVLTPPLQVLDQALRLPEVGSEAERQHAHSFNQQWSVSGLAPCSRSPL